MWLDALIGLVLGIFIAIGALRGALASGLALLSLAAAYVAAILLGPVLGPPVVRALGVPELLGVPIGGTLAFLGTFLLMGVLSFVLRRLERLRRGGRRGFADRALGGLFGAARGALVAILLTVLAGFVDVLRATGTGPALPPIEGSKAAAVTSSLVETGVEAALGKEEPGARLAARMAARPGAAIAELQQIVESPRIETLREDRLFWTYVQSGAVDAALNRGSFLGITYDDTLRRQLADVGLVDAAAAESPQAFRQVAGDVLHEVGPRLRGLSEDPELRELVDDPEVASMLASGDTVALLAHPGFRRLVTRVASQPPESEPGARAAP